VSRNVAKIERAVRQEWPHPAVIAAYLCLFAALIAVSIFAAQHDRFPGDLALTRRVQGLDLPGLRRAMRFSTDLTSPVPSLVALAAAAGAFLALGRPRLAFFAAATLSAHAMGAVLKFFVDRGRPDPDIVDTVRIEERFSYPSGHVEWVVSFEGFVVFAIWQVTTNPVARYVALAVWAVHLALTGLGRIDQGLHWPSDIVAGIMVGALALPVVIWLYRASFHVIPATPREQPARGGRS
jgi:membrane-associated phospholipid phosphatase